MEVVIGKDTSTITEKSFMVPTGCKRLSIEHDLPEEYGFLVFFIIRDPDGKIRFQKQLSCSESRILGHANLFGIDQRPESLDGILIHKEETLLKQDIKAIIKECRERNWLFSVNHPFLYVWKWLMEELPLEAMDCLEIINDPSVEVIPIKK